MPNLIRVLFSYLELFYAMFLVVLTVAACSSFRGLYFSQKADYTSKLCYVSYLERLSKLFKSGIKTRSGDLRTQAAAGRA